MIINKPNLFIVGAPKSGTTAMYTYLHQHPDVFMSCVKEPYYFCRDLMYHRVVRQSENEYLSLFREAEGEKWLGESSVSYLVSRKAAFEISNFNPDARIIIMLRNPVDMMYAMHRQLLFGGVESERDFGKALALEKSRKSGKNIPPSVSLVDLLFYRELAQYSEQVDRYIRIFGREKVHVIIFDDFIADVAATYGEILRFLDIDDSFRPDSFAVVNASKRRRNEKLLQLLNHTSTVSFVRRILPSHSLRQLIAGVLSFLIIKKEPPPPMDPDLRRKLQNEFLPDIERLSLLLDRDLTYWCQL